MQEHLITCLIVAGFFGAIVVWTGPACEEQRTKLRRRLDFPRARARLMLPEPEPCGLCGRRHTLLES